MQLSGLKRCLSCMKGVVKTEGILSLYRSLPVTMIMNAPYAITTVTVNENMKKLIEPKKRKFKFLCYFYCAAIAGAFASVVTCPLDNIKTKLQTQSTMSSCERVEILMNKIEGELKQMNNKKCGVEEDIKKYQLEEEKHLIKYRNIQQTAKVLYQERGFFKGLGPRILFNSPSCAISWASYELMKHTIGGMI